jgi:metal-responsive CopG/Arc/MetJ family transcriptional regulator
MREKTLSRFRQSTEGRQAITMASMKVKTSISISKTVLAEVDRLAGTEKSRSAFVEAVLRSYLLESNKAALHARDLARINRAANQLNLEAEDVLEYQSSQRRKPESPVFRRG